VRGGEVEEKDHSPFIYLCTMYLPKSRHRACLLYGAQQSRKNCQQRRRRQEEGEAANE
jgi:hypothetical protein